MPDSKKPDVDVLKGLTPQQLTNLPKLSKDDVQAVLRAGQEERNREESAYTAAATIPRVRFR